MLRRQRSLLRCLACCVTVGWPGCVLAQAAQPAAAPESSVASYEAAFFTRFAAKNALDMVRQVPGFTIRLGAEKRGLGQADDNVLIDGKRVSGKSNDIETALRQLNATNVVRIDVVDGATLNLPGLTGQVANVITRSGGVSGNFRWDPQIRVRGTAPRLYKGEVSVSGKLGSTDYTLSLQNNDSFRNGNAGPEFAFDGNGVLNDLREEKLTVDGDRPRISVKLARTTTGGTIANINASYERYYFDIHEDSFRSFPGQVDRFRIYDEQQRSYNYEIGGDIDLALASGRLKLIGLRRFESSPVSQTVITSFADGRPSIGQRFTRQGDESETILRGEYKWKGGGADWEISAEGALNSLDAASTLAERDATGSFVDVPLPGGTSTVKEQRGEVALSYGRPLTSRLTMQTSLGGEYSKLEQSGPLGQSRQFVRPKGYVSLAWKASPVLDLSLRVARTVDQLDFFDFVASVNVSGGNANGANPDLRPPQSWDIDLEANRALGPWGSIKARLYTRFITDIVDQIPLDPVGEAVGNLPSARLFGLDWNSTFNFDPIGWRGAKLDLTLRLKHSRLRDPLTGRYRQISEDTRREVEFVLRHDIPNSFWAWGGSVYRFEQTPGIRLDQQSQFVQVPAEGALFIEHKNVFGLTVSAELGNIFGTNENFSRTAYVARRDGPALFTERRFRDFGQILTFGVRGNF